VRGINRWFSRVVYERDNWDARLDQWSQKRGRLSLLIMPSRAAVWLSRRILTLLMVGGHAISCFMTRQMEYDADSYEVKIAGSEAFARTMDRLRDLNLAMFHSAEYMESEFAAKRLPSDLPLFLVTWQRSRSVEVIRAADAPAGRTSGLFDTHPSDGERVAAATRAANRGVLVGGDGSATLLFRDIDAVSRNATRHHYEERGVADEVSLVDAVDSVQASVGREARQQALLSIFEFGVSRFRPLRVPEPGVEDTPAVEIQTWRFPDALERFDDRMMQRTKAFAAQEAFHAGYRGIDPALFGLPEWTLDAATAAEREAIEKTAVLASIIEPYERARMRRVTKGLDRLGGANEARYSAENLTSLVQALNATAASLEVGFDLWRISNAHLILDHLSSDIRGTDPTRERRHTLSAVGRDMLARMRQTLAGVSCPVLLDAGAATTLEQACRLSAIDDPAEGLIAVQTLHTRLLLEVCWLAVRGETLDASAPATC